MQHYDIIGDIHGHADQLESLLALMGYSLKSGVYRHPSNKLILVGDYIDKGNQQSRTIEIVRAMVDSGNAIALMGNHEYNAVCYATESPNQADGYLRPHSSENEAQHSKFLEELPFGSSEYQGAIEWFKTLPCFVDLDGIRVIHACWSRRHLDDLADVLDDNNCLTDAGYITASIKGHKHNHAIETILKGPEAKLPFGCTFKDKGGKTRDAIRVKWWYQGEATYADLALTVPTQCLAQLPEDKLKTSNLLYLDDKPVFFGHYWLDSNPCAQTDYTACLDFREHDNTVLTAYRWRGEGILRNEHFVRLSSHPIKCSNSLITRCGTPFAL